MYEQYKNDVQFVVVYIREAHAIDSRSPMQTKEMVEDPINLIERTAVAKVCLTKLELRPIPAVVDQIFPAIRSVVVVTIISTLSLVFSSTVVVTIRARLPLPGFGPVESRTTSSAKRRPIFRWSTS